MASELLEVLALTVRARNVLAQGCSGFGGHQMCDSAVRLKKSFPVRYVEASAGHDRATDGAESAQRFTLSIVSFCLFSQSCKLSEGMIHVGIERKVMSSSPSVR